MPMQPYSVLFPDAADPVIALTLDRKTGKIPKGTYGFIEFYCTDKGCDCRRTTIFVLNEKMKEKAVISMGFDLDQPLAGPFLDEFHPQSACAEELLALFVNAINRQPEFLESFYRHYREVRSQVEGKKYRGKSFPKAGTVERTACVSPDLPDSFMEVMEALGASGTVTASAKTKSRTAQVTTIHSLAERYWKAEGQSGYGAYSGLQAELRDHVLTHDDFATVIAELLMETADVSSDTDERIDGVLHLLFDTLEILRGELERKRPDSRARMETIQKTLAQKIFLEHGGINLCAAVSNVLMQSRVELSSALHEASSQRMLLNVQDPAMHELPEGEVLEDLFNNIEEMGDGSPFEAMEQLLQLLLLGPIDMQTAIYEEMLGAKSALIRDTAALMLLHPTAEVREEVARLLAVYGKNITPETLRRLIVSRNWFAEALRKNIDQAISAARKGRIDCAPLPRNVDVTVYASPVDGAFAQSFQVIVPEGKGFISCSILLKRGIGVADSFVIPLAGKRELKEFMSMMHQEAAFIESTMDYLDMRVCHALAEGASLGKVPNFWLLHVAEKLGKDVWKGQDFDPAAELAQMHATVADRTPEFLDERTRNKTLKESADWLDKHDFILSWFEDDSDVEQVVAAVFKKKRSAADREWQAVQVILTQILEKRRDIWLERLTLTALWLKSSRKPPLSWHQMLFIAEMVADKNQPLAKIPLMEEIAIETLGACLARMESV